MGAVVETLDALLASSVAGDVRALPLWRSVRQAFDFAEHVGPMSEYERACDLVGCANAATEACIGCGTAMYCCAAHLQQDLMRKRGHAVTCITAQPMPTFNLASSGMRLPLSPLRACGHAAPPSVPCARALARAHSSSASKPTQSNHRASVPHAQKSSQHGEVPCPVG